MLTQPSESYQLVDGLIFILRSTPAYNEFLMTEPVTAATVWSIPLPQIVGFAVTILASFLSARWGTAETRKQFQKKTEDDERAAAAELVPLLLKFALDCDKKKIDLSLYISSDGHAGADETVHGIDFPSAIHSAAARLGPRITERAIKLEVTKTRAERYVADASDFVENYELDQKILSFLALLSLRARHLCDMAAEKVGLAMRHPEDDMDRLLKESMHHMHEIDSGSEANWY
ncbi:hypothetical protein AXW67_18215 [Bradyrhizobium neotropicale]|uniref:Uncharacterized protein n=2 Tax=Bradyrhizobium neotropicale TaxID=1497615 RepID=A0A176Z3J2_9BRAD|nr:hypothetical protein AXW67_18215 [Bradyrhizobium neotropicale]